MRIFCRLFLAIVLCGSICSFAGESEHRHSMPTQLGSVHFPTTCNAAAQISFDRGVAWLHSFGYEAAEAEFIKTAQADPQCAMAEWGIAMSRYHQLWDVPSPQDIRIANAALAKAANIRADARERAYVDAISEFYRDTSKRDHQQRAEAYSQKMEAVYKAYPQDSEAAVFYALSLLASAPSKSSIPNRKQAAAILEKIFAEQPLHPGVAHYLIHAYDRPELAAMGLPAARKYAKIAPSSVHALHMPSHIFVRLGLWQESIDSNLAALKASHDAHEASEEAYGNQLHSIDFIITSALQIGRVAMARDYAEQATRIPASDEGLKAQEQIQFPAVIAMETQGWRSVLQIPQMANANAESRALLSMYRTIAAARMGDVPAAQKSFSDLNAAVQQIKSSRDPEMFYAAKFADEMTLRPAAWLAFAEGKHDEAIAKLQDKLKTESSESEGLGPTIHEMLGDMLILENKPQEALAAYEISLKIAPNRFNSLYGAAHAAKLAGKSELAMRYYSQLVTSCAQADSSRSELNQARAFLEAHKQVARMQ